jgi:hypothetical protein
VSWKRITFVLVPLVLYSVSLHETSSSWEKPMVAAPSAHSRPGDLLEILEGDVDARVALEADPDAARGPEELLTAGLAAVLVARAVLPRAGRAPAEGGRFARGRDRADHESQD